MMLVHIVSRQTDLMEIRRHKINIEANWRITCNCKCNSCDVVNIVVPNRQCTHFWLIRNHLMWNLFISICFESNSYKNHAVLYKLDNNQPRKANFTWNHAKSYSIPKHLVKIHQLKFRVENTCSIVVLKSFQDVIEPWDFHLFLTLFSKK